jgi:hypothetical protein
MFMKYSNSPAWLFILFGLALSTVGWALKLGSSQRADAFIVAGTGLVLFFGALALWALVRRLDVGLRGPLGTIAAGLLISLLAATNLAAPVAMGLAVIGGVLAATGTAWLLVRLHRTLEPPAIHHRHKYPA